MAKDEQPQATLAAAVRARRTQLGWSQRELAERSDVSEPSINVIENARQESYRGITLSRIGAALGWDHGELGKLMAEDGYSLPEPGQPRTGDGRDRPNLAALHGKLDQLSEKDRAIVEDMIDRLLDE